MLGAERNSKAKMLLTSLKIKLGISPRKALQQSGLAELLAARETGWLFKGQGIHLLPRSDRSAPIPALPAG